MADTANGPVCPAGFAAAGAWCGVKPSGQLDVAVITCPAGGEVAAVFTRNRLCAAPVVLSRRHLDSSGGRFRALIVNSGCANAATGRDGERRAERVCDALAARLGCPTDQVLMNSTGVIGTTLPDQAIVDAMPGLATSVAADGLADAARAIMTTDTVPKMTERTVEHDGRSLRVVGIAKGSGMIHPNMATMIAVIMTDAALPASDLDGVLRGAVERSFHRISVDGDTSTNDAVFMLSSGAAGAFPRGVVQEAADAVALDLARMIIRDGEGAKKLISVQARGASSADDALRVARTVAGSLLVRTAVAGGDPNWGRILAAVGRSGVPFEAVTVELIADGITLFADGAPATASPDRLRRVFAGPEVDIEIDLGQGEAADAFYTCDLTEQYVHINADYTS